MPCLADTIFYRTVIYLCEHNEEGAMGLIINRPTQLTLSKLLLYLDSKVPYSSDINVPIFFGGPVQKNKSMILHTCCGNWKNTTRLTDTLFLSSSMEIISTIGSNHGPKNLIITLGYAVWDAGQLEQELAENSWLTVAVLAVIAFE
jgi:putative transcriptional regulator